MFDRLNHETWVCSVKGHVTPAAAVAQLGPEDAGFGIDVNGRWRFSRCLRCDVWIGGPPPERAERERLPPPPELDLPRRGKELRQAIILRLISIERGIHSVVFAAIAVLGIVVRSHLAGIRSSVQRFLDTLAQNESQTGRTTNHGILAREGTRVLHLRTGTLEVLILTATAYALLEGVEAVGLWYEKRWGEYLTAVGTAGLLPLEIVELTKTVTVLKVGALIVNVAVLVYLVYAKRLFGIRRHAGEGEPGDRRDPAAFSPPY